MLILSPAPTLPVIDISPFLSQDESVANPGSQKATAEALHVACSQVGFFYVVGHGIREDQATRLHSLAKDFFSRPSEEKAEISIYKNDMARGYQRLVCTRSAIRSAKPLTSIYCNPGRKYNTV